MLIYIMMARSYFPVNIDITNKKCLVIGGGKVAERKVNNLLKFGAAVCLISPEVTKNLKRLINLKKVSFLKKKYDSGCLSGQALVIAATDDKRLNKNIFLDAQKKNVLINVVDAPSLCSFIVPSVIKRGPLVISISTSGQAPAFSKALRKTLEKLIKPETGRIVMKLGKARREKIAAKSTGA